MSVSKMKKLLVFVDRDEVDLLTKKLIRLRCVEIRAADSETDDAEAVHERAAEIVLGGKSVSVQTSVPERLVFREIEYFKK